MMPDPKHLGAALLAAAMTAVSVAFFAGCFYPYLLHLLLAGSPASTHAAKYEVSATILLNSGFITALVALPATLVLTYGVGFPLFRQWVRRGFSGFVAYVGGGIVVAIIGASIVALAHFYCGFLSGSDFSFAMLILAVCGPVAGFVVWYVLMRLGSQ